MDKKNTHTHIRCVKPEHNFAEIIFSVERLRPLALCERWEGANDLLPLISNLSTLEASVHTARLCVCMCVCMCVCICMCMCVCVCVSNGFLVTIRSGPWSQINESTVIKQGVEPNYLIPINVIKKNLCYLMEPNETQLQNQACAHKKLNQSCV